MDFFLHLFYDLLRRLFLRWQLSFRKHVACEVGNDVGEYMKAKYEKLMSYEEYRFVRFTCQNSWIGTLPLKQRSWASHQPKSQSITEIVSLERRLDKKTWGGLNLLSIARQVPMCLALF
jgi:hypothetical protein